MNKYELLTAEYKADRQKQIELNTEFITHGYMSTWHTNEKTQNDNGIRRYSTDRRWEQYQAGEITRDQAIAYAVKRMKKEAEKTTAAGLAKLERIAAADDLTFATVNVSYSRYYNASAESLSNGGKFNGRAGGYGYDKTSTAVAEAFNQDDVMLKILYDLKEKGLSDGLDDNSDTSVTRHDNRNIIGYGSGYSVLPYYEGGVGISCYESILNKAGYRFQVINGKHDLIIRIERKKEA